MRLIKYFIFSILLVVFVNAQAYIKPQYKAFNRLLDQDYFAGNAPQIMARLKEMSKGLHYQRFLIVKPSFWKEAEQPTKPFPKYLSPSSRPKTLAINKIYFMQESANVLFHDSAYDVIIDAKKIQQGTLSLQKIPEIHVWQDSSGKIWTLNHRRLAAYVLSGVVKQVPVRWASRQRVLKNIAEYTTTTKGNVMYLYLDRNIALAIKRPLR